MNKIKGSLPAIAVIALLLAAWWLIVAETHSVIFPTPWQVVTGTAELIKDGTLFMHIGASLMRVGVGFSLAVLVAVPLGLWLVGSRGLIPRSIRCFRYCGPSRRSRGFQLPFCGSASAMRRRSISSLFRQYFR